MSGWPWPLDGVQTWFEGFWNHVTKAAYAAVSQVSNWIWSSARWLKTALEGSLKWLSTSLTRGFRDLTSVLGRVRDAVTRALSTAVAGLRSRLERGFTAMGTSLSRWVSNIGRSMADFFKKMGRDLSSTASWISKEFKTEASRILGQVQTHLDDALKGGMTWVQTAIAGVADALGAGFQAFFRWLLESLRLVATSIAGAVGTVRGAIEGVFAPIGRGIMETLKAAVSPGSPEPETLKMAEAFAEGYLDQLMELSKFEEGSVPELDVLLPKAIGVVALNMGAALGVEVAGAALDQTHPFKNIGFQNIAIDLVSSVQMPAMIGPILSGPVWPGVLIPLRYRFNEKYPTAIPAPGDLVDMAARGTCPAEDYTQAMKFHALDETWSSRRLAAAYRTPGFPELQIMIRRGVLTVEGAMEALKLQGVRADYLKRYPALVERIPMPMDLVRMAVREAFTRPELDAEFPTEFATQMKRQGYADVWARYFWRAHWVLVPLGQLYAMLHRGLIDESTMSEQLKYHDYPPEWRALLMKLSWDLPGRIDARWMFRWGMIDIEGLRDLLVARGLDPDWADRVAGAYAKNQWLTEINRLRDNAKRDYVRGYKTEPELRADLVELGYPPEWVEFHVRDSLEDGERALLDDMVDALGDGYLKDLVTDDELEQRLGAILVRPRALEMELERLYIKKWRKPRTPTADKVPVLPVSTLRYAFREEIIPAGVLEAELLARGYTSEDVELIVSLEEARK